MGETYNPARTGMSRVFLIEGGARPDHVPSYEGCMRAGSPEQTFGDVERQECPSPDAYEQWDVVSEVQGGEEPPSISLNGHYAVDLTSKMLRLGRRRCPFDLHVHFGRCEDPDNFDQFTKAMVFEIARFTNWTADELGALQSADSTGIMENADITGRIMYEVVPLTVTEEAQTVTVNPLNDVIFASSISCGDCDDEDTGCDIIMACGAATPGSPGTAPDLVWSSDGGVTWFADDISTLDASEEADGLAQVGSRIVVVSNDDGGIHWKLRATILAGTAFAWNRVTTGIVVTGEPNDIWSVGSYAFVVGDAGYVYGTANPPAGLSVLDPGDATAQNLNKVMALNRRFVVAVGESGAIVRTTNGSAFGLITPPTGLADGIDALWVTDENVWYIGTDAGEVHYTVNGGVSWTQLTNFPVTLVTVTDIAFHNRSVGYLSGTIAGTAGVVLRTFNGGESWVALPEGLATLPANDEIRALAACEHNENLFVGVGLADDAADGIVIVGQE